MTGVEMTQEDIEQNTFLIPSLPPSLPPLLPSVPPSRPHPQVLLSCPWWRGASKSGSTLVFYHAQDAEL